MTKNHSSLFHRLEGIAFYAQHHAKENLTSVKSKDADRQVLSALTCFYASQSLKEEGVDHAIEGGSSMWRIRADDRAGSVLTTTYNKKEPMELSAWIRIGNLIYDPSVGVVIDATIADEPVSWRPDFLMIHVDDVYDASDVYHYEAGAVHYRASEKATRALSEAFCLMPIACGSTPAALEKNYREVTPLLLRRLFKCFFSAEVNHGNSPVFL